VQVIFEGDDGFLIDESRVPFRGLRIWQPEERQPQGLVPLLPALSYVIFRTLDTCDDGSGHAARLRLGIPAAAPVARIREAALFKSVNTPAALMSGGLAFVAAFVALMLLSLARLDRIVVVSRHG
jgi:hypothetical protein